MSASFLNLSLTSSLGVDVVRSTMLFHTKIRVLFLISKKKWGNNLRIRGKKRYSFLYYRLESLTFAPLIVGYESILLSGGRAYFCLANIWHGRCRV